MADQTVSGPRVLGYRGVGLRHFRRAGAQVGQKRVQRGRILVHLFEETGEIHDLPPQAQGGLRQVRGRGAADRRRRGGERAGEGAGPSLRHLGDVPARAGNRAGGERVSGGHAETSNLPRWRRRVRAEAVFAKPD